MFPQVVKDHLRGITHPRSPHWPQARKLQLKQFPQCAACGCKRHLEVHHKMPFHIDPDLELEPTNLITLCRRCHLFIGHLDSWKAYNENVDADAARWLAKIVMRC